MLYSPILNTSSKVCFHQETHSVDFHETLLPSEGTQQLNCPLKLSQYKLKTVFLLLQCSRMGRTKRPIGDIGKRQKLRRIEENVARHLSAICNSGHEEQQFSPDHEDDVPFNEDISLSHSAKAQNASPSCSYFKDPITDEETSFHTTNFTDEESLGNSSESDATGNETCSNFSQKLAKNDPPLHPDKGNDEQSMAGGSEGPESRLGISPGPNPNMGSRLKNTAESFVEAFENFEASPS